MSLILVAMPHFLCESDCKENMWQISSQIMYIRYFLAPCEIFVKKLILVKKINIINTVDFIFS